MAWRTDNDERVHSGRVCAPLKRGSWRIERTLPLLDVPRLQPAEQARTVYAHAVHGGVAVLQRGLAGKRHGRGPRRQMRHLVEWRQHVQLRGGRMLQHGDHHLERLQARDRMAVAHSPPVARAAERLEHEGRLVTAAKLELHLAARDELNDPLEDK